MAHDENEQKVVNTCRYGMPRAVKIWVNTNTRWLTSVQQMADRGPDETGRTWDPWDELPLQCTETKMKVGSKEDNHFALKTETINDVLWNKLNYIYRPW